MAAAFFYDYVILTLSPPKGKDLLLASIGNGAYRSVGTRNAA